MLVSNIQDSNKLFEESEYSASDNDLHGMIYAKKTRHISIFDYKVLHFLPVLSLLCSMRRRKNRHVNYFGVLRQLIQCFVLFLLQSEQTQEGW